MIENNQKISPSDFSFTLVDKPSSSTAKSAGHKNIMDHLPAPLGLHSLSPSFTLSSQQKEIPLYNSSVSSIESSSKDESPNVVRLKKGNCGMSVSVEHDEVRQQRRMPYSVRKIGKEVR